MISRRRGSTHLTQTRMLIEGNEVDPGLEVRVD